MSAPVKILLTIRQGKIGGGESHVLDLVRCLDKSKFTPIVLSFTDGPMVERLRGWGVRTHVIYTERPFDFSVWGKVTALLAQEEVQLIHAHGTRANSNVFRAAKNLNLPLIYSVHGWSFHQDQGYFLKTFREAGERFLVEKSDLTICVSESNKQDGVNRVGLKRTRVINYGIDLEKFNPDKPFDNLKKELKVSEDEKLVGYLVRMTIQKDPHTMIRAIAEVVKKFTKVKFLIVGNGDLKESTVALAEKLGVSKYIVFQDFRLDVPNVLSGIDVYCLPSLWEGLPIGLLEAMAMKKGIVATPVDGTKEVISEGHTGMLVPCQSPDELAKAILFMLEHPDQCKEYGRNARRLVEEKFDAKKMTKEIEAVYTTFLTQTKPHENRD